MEKKKGFTFFIAITVLAALGVGLWYISGILIFDSFINQQKESCITHMCIAERLVKDAKKHHRLDPKDLAVIKYHLTKDGKTYADFGTSDEEIKNLTKDYYITDAKRSLDYARGRGGSIANLKCMSEYMRDGMLTYEDIGTTAEEVEVLRKDAYIRCVISNFYDAKVNINDRFLRLSSLYRMDQCLMKAGLVYKDLGIDPKEIQSLRNM